MFYMDALTPFLVYLSDFFLRRGERIHLFSMIRSAWARTGPTHKAHLWQKLKSERASAAAHSRMGT